MTDRVKALADTLLHARRKREQLGRLSRSFVPASEEEAYAVQAAVVAALGAVGGWKVGASSPTAEPSAAPLLAAGTRPSPARWELPAGVSVGIEGELAFRFARALPPRGQAYGEDEVWDAIDTLHPAIELVQSRFADPQAADKLALLADNLANYGFCRGAAVPDWRQIDFLRQPVSLDVDGAERVRAIGGNAAGHPRRLLAWLANHCARRGRGLAAGDIVTTGTHTGLITLPAPANVVVHFAGVGEARLTLAA
ncbi:MAG TPA: fumarylacetoacetate hydrolase family protein [Stellaceae bacterium]|nr:fumarylacetoacetate hydrolase family protein [Stellaceae bacterium]